MNCELCKQYEQVMREKRFIHLGPRFQKDGKWYHTVFVMTNTFELQPCTDGD